jgi:hypothetical protein
MESERRDIRELPLSEWGHVDESSVGLIVAATVLCAHPCGLGVNIREIGAFGHVNSPRVSDEGYSLDLGRALVGEEALQAGALGVRSEQAVAERGWDGAKQGVAIDGVMTGHSRPCEVSCQSVPIWKRIWIARCRRCAELDEAESVDGGY